MIGAAGKDGEAMSGGNHQGYEPQGYLRSLASLDVVHTIPTRNAFDSLADHSSSHVDVTASSVEVPIVDFIVPARRARNKTGHKNKFMAGQCENYSKSPGSH